MRKSFTRLFGFLLLNVMMLFSFGLYAQEAQSTVELYAPTVGVCYNAANSYTAKVQVKDFIAIKSFDLTLSFDNTEFQYASIANVNSALGSITVTQPSAGKIKFEWSSSSAVTINNNVIGTFFDVNFTGIDTPVNFTDNKLDSPLTWDASSYFYYAATEGGSDPVRTTVSTPGSLLVTDNYPVANFTYTATAASCAGGEALVNITSPVATGMKYYFNGSTTASTTPTASVATTNVNNYVIVEDVDGCRSHRLPFVVSAPAPFEFIGVTTENAKCKGDNGEIQFSISGGTGPYTYWVIPISEYNGGFMGMGGFQANFDLLGGNLNAPIFASYKYSNFQVLKRAGTYKVAVTDNNGCINLGNSSNWKDAIITEPNLAIDFLAGTASATCYGSATGSLTVSSVTGGTVTPTGSGYTVSLNGSSVWNTVGTTSTMTYTYTKLNAGTHTVTVKDGNGCMVSKAVTVGQPNALKFTLSYTDAACAIGGTNSGSITITSVSGGLGSYEFAVLKAGQTLTSTTTWIPTSQTWINLAPDYYSIWVRDVATTCLPVAFANQDGSGNILPIQRPGQLTFTTNAATALTKCSGTNFTLVVTAASGTAPYTYSFDEGSYGSTNTKTFTNLVGTVTVTVSVKDANSCVVTQVIGVTAPAPLVVNAFTGILSPTCPSGNDGRATVNVTGGVKSSVGTGYMYSTDNINFNISNVLALPGGSTKVYVKDANGCTASGTVTVTALPAINLTAGTVGSNNCQGDKNVMITVNHTEHPDRTVQYYYAPTAAGVFAGTVFIPYSANSVTTVNPTTFGAVGTIWIGSRDQFGCISGTVSVTITEKKKLSAEVLVTNSGCSAAFDGTLTINTKDGNGKPKYAIVNNPIAISNLTDVMFLDIDTYSSTTSVGQQIVNAQKGTYYVVLRDGCITNNTLFYGPFEVKGYTGITLDTYTVDNPLCNAGGTATITVTKVSGGTPGGLDNGATAVTSYFYKLTSTYGTVTNTTGVFGGLKITEVDGVGSGGTTTYTLEVTDGSNCPAATRAIAVTKLAQVKINDWAVTHFTCKGSNDGRITVYITGGKPGYSLAVNASVNKLGTDIKTSDWIPFATGTTSKTYIATEAGVHYLYVKDANGCLGSTVSVTVLEPTDLTPVVGTQTNVTCDTGNNGSVQINVTGGWPVGTATQTILYTLTTGGTTTNTTGLFTGLTAKDYVVKVSATNAAYTVGKYTYPAIACPKSVAFTITQPVPYSYQAAVTAVACKDGSNGSLKVTVLAGSVATTTSTGAEYYVQLTSTLSPTYTAGSAWKLTSGKVYTFNNLPHGHYSVWISNKNDNTGCILPTGTETITAEMTANGGPYKVVQSWEVAQPGSSVSATVTWNQDVTCYGGNDGKFTVNASGGTVTNTAGVNVGYTYAAKLSTYPTLLLVPAASEFQASNVFANATAGTWIIWAKDANGCVVGGEGVIEAPIDEYRVSVRQPNPVSFSTTTSNVKCFAANDGKITLTPIVSAGAPYSYIITGKDYTGASVMIEGTTTSTTKSSYEITGIPANKTVGSTATNVYTITITDKKGCTASATTTQITQYPVLDVNITLANGAFLCPGDNSGVIEAVTTGGTGTGTYTYSLYRDDVLFTANVNVPSFIVEVGHTWKVVVKDANNCTDSDTRVINTPVGVNATLSETTCYNDPTASVIVRVTGDVGRTFKMRYRLNTASYPATWTDMPNGEKAISGLLFSNVNVGQNFYYFQIMDNMGCMTEITEKAFVPTQHPLQVTPVVNDLNASVSITGGISPYTWQVGTSTPTTLAVNGNTFQVVNLPAGANMVTVYDAHGCVTTATMTVLPLTVVVEPASGSNQMNTFDVKLTFNRDVTGVASSTMVTGDTSTATATVTGSGKVYTVTIMGADKVNISLALGSGIKDMASNALAAQTFTYTIGDHVAPTLVVTPPASPVKAVFTVGLAFSEPVSGVLAGITVTGGTLNDVSALAGGKDYVLTIASTEQKLVTINIANTIKDLSLNMNPFAGQVLSYTTGDFTAPELVTWTPLDETTANNHPTFKMTLSENVIVGAGGNLKVYKVATSTAVLTIPVTSAMISGKDVTVTYTATNGLDKDTRYYVLVDGDALKDNAGNKFAGVSDQAAWTFKTGANFVTGIDPINSSLEFKVYPNPFVDYVTVTNVSKLSKIVVTNIAGQRVKEIVNPTDRIQLNELRSGAYFISLYDMDNVITKTVKAIKQ